jgi:hypothetical protein
VACEGFVRLTNSSISLPKSGSEGRDQALLSSAPSASSVEKILHQSCRFHALCVPRESHGGQNRRQPLQRQLRKVHRPLSAALVEKKSFPLGDGFGLGNNLEGPKEEEQVGARSEPFVVFRPGSGTNRLW